MRASAGSEEGGKLTPPDTFLTPCHLCTSILNKNHQILNHPSLTVNIFTIAIIKYDKVPLPGMITFLMHFK
jgi:hypothetical protein